MMDLLKSFMVAAKRRRRMFEDSTRGIEYNQLVPNNRVSRRIYTADIARNPRIVSNDFVFINVQEAASRINAERELLDRKVYKVKGRST